MLILKTPTSLNIIGKVQIMKVMREREEKTAFNFTVIVKKKKNIFVPSPIFDSILISIAICFQRLFGNHDVFFGNFLP